MTSDFVIVNFSVNGQGAVILVAILGMYIRQIPYLKLGERLIIGMSICEMGLDVKKPA